MKPNTLRVSINILVVNQTGMTLCCLFETRHLTVVYNSVDGEQQNVDGNMADSIINIYIYFLHFFLLHLYLYTYTTYMYNSNLVLDIRLVYNYLRKFVRLVQPTESSASLHHLLSLTTRRISLDSQLYRQNKYMYYHQADKARVMFLFTLFIYSLI